MQSHVHFDLKCEWIAAREGFFCLWFNLSNYSCYSDNHTLGNGCCMDFKPNKRCLLLKLPKMEQQAVPKQLEVVTPVMPFVLAGKLTGHGMRLHQGIWFLHVQTTQEAVAGLGQVGIWAAGAFCFSYPRLFIWWQIKEKISVLTLFVLPSFSLYFYCQ